MTGFRSTVELFGKTATGLRVPSDVVAALGSAKRPKVRVTVGDHTYRSTVAVYGDEFFLPLNRSNREAAGVAAGDEVEVSLELDDEPRTIEVPDDLGAALDAKPSARDNFDRLSYSHQREYVEWVADAKRPETRWRRIAQTVEQVAEGRPLR